MRKVFAILLAVILCCGFACAEEAEAIHIEPVDPEYLAEDEDELPPDPDLFSGVWLSGTNCIAEFWWEGIGYRVWISKMDTKSHFTEWEYSGIYDPNTGIIETMPFGYMSDITYDDQGIPMTWDILYENGIASFLLNNEGCVLWNDQLEDAGKDLVFTRISDNLNCCAVDVWLILANDAVRNIPDLNMADAFGQIAIWLEDMYEHDIYFECFMQSLNDPDRKLESLDDVKVLFDKVIAEESEKQEYAETVDAED